MTQLCGWFGAPPVGGADDALRRMTAAARGPAGLGAASPVQSNIFGRAALALVRPAGTHTSMVVEVDGVHVVAIGHPRWCDGADRTANIDGFARAVRTEGAGALKRLQGDFAVAVWDEQRATGFVAIDRIGVHQIVYAKQGGGLIFGSTLDQLRAHPNVSTQLSQQGIFDYLYYHVCPGPETIFEGLRRLPAGQVLVFGGAGPAEPVPYWTMQFVEEGGRSVEQWEAEFLSGVRDAVAEAQSGAATGSFLSGGTDSSTVSGMLGRVTGQPARSFSIGFDAEGFDEMEYARLAARHFGCEHHEYYVTPKDVVDAVPRIATWYDQPFGNASAIPTYYCARVAREHGIERMLAGDGGDELFGGNERYAKQRLLGHYHRVPAWVRHGLVEPALLSLPREMAFKPLQKLRSYVEQARPDMPIRYENYNVLSYLGHGNVFTPGYLSIIRPDHPLQLLEQCFQPYERASLINQMLAIDLRFVLADGDLPKVTQMCGMAGVDVAFPLLDDRVVAYSARLPADLKLRGTKLRWLFKHALREFLPQEIITKTKHGFGLPVGTWLVGHKPLLDLAHDSVGSLRQRGFIEPRFIDELFDRRLKEHAGFFGTMVWILMMLGLWCESRRV